MTVNPSNCMNILKSTGGSDFSFDFRIFLTEQNKFSLKVTIVDSNGVETKQVEGTDYTVNWQPQGGIVEFKNPVDKDKYVIIESNLDYNQNKQFTDLNLPYGNELTRMFDRITMQIVQNHCLLQRTPGVLFDPKTGSYTQIKFSTLEPDKILQTDPTGKIVQSSSYSVQDLKNLGQNTTTASTAAQNAANTATTASTNAQNAASTATAAQNAASTASTNAQNAANTAQNAANTASTVDQKLTPFLAIASSPPKPNDIIAGNSMNQWSTTNGDAFLKDILNKMLNDDEVLAKVKGVLQGYPTSALGGGGSGGGANLANIFKGGAKGDALVANPASATNYELKQVVTGDPSSSGKVPVYNAQGGFTPTDFTAGSSVTVDPGSNTGITIDPKITLSANRANGGCFPLQACYDVTTKTWKITEDTMSGSTKLPNPPVGADQQWLQTEVATNGGVVPKWHQLPGFASFQATDDGKGLVWDSAKQEFVPETFLPEDELTETITKVSGIVDGIEVEMNGYTPTIQPFKGRLVKPDGTVIDFATKQARTIQAGISDGDSIFYNPTTDAFVNFRYSSIPTDVYDYAVPLFKGVKRKSSSGQDEIITIPIYNPISHNDRILKEIGDILGPTGIFVELRIFGTSLRNTSAHARIFLFDSAIPYSSIATKHNNLSSYSLVHNVDLNLYLMSEDGLITTNSFPDVKKQYLDSSGAPVDLSGTEATVLFVYIPVLKSLKNGANNLIQEAYILLVKKKSATFDDAILELEEYDELNSLANGYGSFCVYAAQIVIDATGKNKVYNRSDIRGGSGSVTYGNILPSTQGVAQGTVLTVDANGNYVLNPNNKPIVLPTMNDGQVLAQKNGVLTAVDPATVGAPVIDPLASKYCSVVFKPPGGSLTSSNLPTILDDTGTAYRTLVNVKSYNYALVNLTGGGTYDVITIETSFGVSSYQGVIKATFTRNSTTTGEYGDSTNIDLPFTQAEGSTKVKIYGVKDMLSFFLPRSSSNPSQDLIVLDIVFS